MPGQLTYFDKIEQINIKVKIDKYDLKELSEFVSYYSTFLLNDSQHIHLMRACKQLSNKLTRKINSLNEPKSLRFNFFEIHAITFLYMSIATVISLGELHSNYPVVHNIIFERMRNQMPNNIILWE